MEGEHLQPLTQRVRVKTRNRRSVERRARYNSQLCRAIFIAKHGIQSRIKFMRVQRVSSVAKQYDQPKETEGGGECSLVGLCGLHMFSKCDANSINGKIHRFQRGIPLQRNTTSPNRPGEGGKATWRGCVGYKCRRDVAGLLRLERRTVRNLCR